MLHVIENEERSAEENMRFDEKLLLKTDPYSNPILHLYKWKEPSLTHGYFLDPNKYLNISELKKQGLNFGKRPTGGGIIFHTWDVAFAVIIPSGHSGYSLNTLENYALINERVKEAVAKLIEGEKFSLLPIDPIDSRVSVSNFCMAKPTIYDVMLGDRKIAGAAQRRKKNAFLHQGSISLAQPDFNLLKKVLLDSEVMEAMRLNTFAPFLGDWRSEEFNWVKKKLQAHLIEAFSSL
ncbi:MAG: hypothetical protein P0S95_01945 [Rhabdochlamydiaceae bacterium]|nr:hypothetical protein [Candidatus Amphrikana amoebophyrae]